MAEMFKIHKFTEKQILGLIPAQALLDYDRAEEVINQVAAAQLRDALRQMVSRLLEPCPHYADYDHRKSVKDCSRCCQELLDDLKAELARLDTDSG